MWKIIILIAKYRISDGIHYVYTMFGSIYDLETLNFCIKIHNFCFRAITTSVVKHTL